MKQRIGIFEIKTHLKECSW